MWLLLITVSIRCPILAQKRLVLSSYLFLAGARFLNINLSSLLDKWYGESQKRVEALFTLALKVRLEIQLNLFVTISASPLLIALLTKFNYIFLTISCK